MAPSSVMNPTKSSLLFLLLTLSICSTTCTILPLPPVEQNLTLYIRAVLAGPNTNLVRVAGIPGNRWSLADFATVLTFDSNVSEDPSPSSPTVGRAQGLYVIASLNGSDAYLFYSIVFTDTARANSTLEIQGRFKQNGEIGEQSVVSGTNKYRLAKGYLVATPLVSNSTDLLVRVDITVRLD